MANVDYERRAEILKALAHSSRLKILDALAAGDRCVCELQEIVGSSMPTISRHLSQMKAAGIVAIGGVIGARDMFVDSLVSKPALS